MRPPAFLTLSPLPRLHRALAPRRRELCACAPPPTPATSSPPPETKKRILSGVQPTGALHLGNYLGALRGWVVNQDRFDNTFFVVDLHALTVSVDVANLSSSTLDAVAMYLASGIDPSQSSIFVQSHVRAHAELTWLLNCITPIGWLERMIQFKEKRAAGGVAGVGLFDYPVLMAADVLLYQTDLVPVGEDQRQHIELARDIARRYNDLFCSDARLSKSARKKADKARGGPRPQTFREPEALLVGGDVARVMSLQDGRRKMSKSDENDASRINLTDGGDEIVRKVKRCKTDSVEGLFVDEDGLGPGGEERPECVNLRGIYGAMTGKDAAEVAREVEGMRWGQFKPVLTEALVEGLRPIQEKYAEIRADDEYLASVLRSGYESANEEAERTLDMVKSDMGLLLPRSIGIGK